MKENILKLIASAVEILDNLENISLFTPKSLVLDHVAKSKSRFWLFSSLDAFAYKYFNYIIKIFIRMTSMSKNGTLKETVEALNSLSSHNDIIELKFKSGRRIVLARVGYDISFESALTSTHSNLRILTNDAKRALAKYVMEYQENKLKKMLWFPSNLNN